MGDVLIIISYAIMELEEAKSFNPALVFPNEVNNHLN
ncbi:MAG: aspartate 1-decarboxylase [Flavobacteriaceae bacterium]